MPSTTLLTQRTCVALRLITRVGSIAIRFGKRTPVWFRVPPPLLKVPTLIGWFFFARSLSENRNDVANVASEAARRLQRPTGGYRSPRHADGLATGPLLVGHATAGVTEGSVLWVALQVLQACSRGPVL